MILQVIRGERKLVDVCREHDLKQSDVEGWMDTFVKGGERSLKARAEDEQAVHEAEVRELRAKIGELVLELDARNKLAALSGNPRPPSNGAGRDACGGEGGVDHAAVPVVRAAALDVVLSRGAAASR
jgi:transposase-like protein